MSSGESRGYSLKRPHTANGHVGQPTHDRCRVPIHRSTFSIDRSPTWDSVGRSVDGLPPARCHFD